MAGEWTLHQVGELIEGGALVVGDGYRAKNSELTNLRIYDFSNNRLTTG